jgi:hypothetical protein
LAAYFFLYICPKNDLGDKCIALYRRQLLQKCRKKTSEIFVAKIVIITRVINMITPNIFAP